MEWLAKDIWAGSYEKDVNKRLTSDEQLDKLASHGIIISDREKAKDVLKRVNYYRVTGYALQFRQDPSSSDYYRRDYV